MLNLIHAVILGLIEGITEFLPISSTAHLILAADILKIPQTDYLKSFQIIIQSGAILAVIFLFWRDFLNPKTIKRVIFAFIPTGIIGLVFYAFVKDHLLGNITIVLLALVIGGLILILFEKWHGKKENFETDIFTISYFHCLLIGLFQAIAMIPGVSRSAATIIGGLSLKIPRATIVKFSFLLAVPTMIAATGYDFWESANVFSANQISFLAVGFFISFLSAIATIRWLLEYVKSRDFKLFGVYRIILAILFMVLAVL